MFENESSRIGTGARGALRLEALEDRTTPAVVGLISPQLGALSQTAFSAVDRMFVTDAARFSLMESWLGSLLTARASTNTQVQALGQELVAVGNSAFLQELPLLLQSGLGLSFTATDDLLLRDLPTINGTTDFSQILLTSAVIQVQQVSLFQAEAAFGNNTTARGFAQTALPVLQSQLQTTLNLLGQAGTATTFSMFNQIGQFGTTSVLGASGLFSATTAFGTTGTLNSALGTTFFNIPLSATNTFTTSSVSSALGAFGTTSQVGFFPQVGMTTIGSGGTPGTFGSSSTFGFGT